MASRKHQTDELPLASNKRSEAGQGHTMNQPAETMPDAAAMSVDASGWKQRRIFVFGFLTACAVAMLVWLTGLGWAAISALEWLFS
jgi:hypothetical protein